LGEFGFNPLIGYVLVLMIFLAFSLVLFHQTAFAEYIYILFKKKAVRKTHVLLKLLRTIALAIMN
jgi:hypothetical protein